MTKNSIIEYLFLSLLLSVSLIAEDNVTEDNCTITQEMSFQPIIDDSGKEILTSNKIYKHCVAIKNVRGTCLEWYNSETSSNLPEVYGIAVEEYESASDISEVLTTVSAINHASVIFSGVKGYCEDGYASDYSWTEDPMLWTSITMQAISAMGDDPVVDEASAEKTMAEQEFDAAESNLDTAQENFNTSEVEYYEAIADGADTDVIYSLEAEMLEDAGTLEIASAEYSTEAFELQDATNMEDLALENQTGIQEFSGYVNEGYSGCATTASISLLAAAIDFKSPLDDDCDPVDEFCNGEGDGIEVSQDDPTMVYTLEQPAYDNMITSKPDLIDAIEVIDIDASSGYITFRIKSSSEIIGNDLNNEDVKDAQADAKQKQFELKAAIITIELAVCTGMNAYDVNFGDEGSSSSDIDYEDAASGIVQSVLIQILPFPYNTIATLVMKLANSYEEIRSCEDEGDAEKAGGRHVKAYRGLRYGTCHPITNSKVVEEWPGGDTMRTAYSYCCYESSIAKLLMVQIKSQLGKGWTHCTDVTLNELSHVKFKNCSSEEIDPALNGGYKDGASFRGTEFVDYDMTQSYQFKYQCMNLEGLREYIETQIQMDFSDTQINDYLENFTFGDS